MDENTIPQTFSYLLLGLGGVAVFVLGYVGTLMMRYRNLQKDMELIRELAEDN